MQFIRVIARQVTVFHQGEILVEDTVDECPADPLVRDVYLGKQAARMMLEVQGLRSGYGRIPILNGLVSRR